MKRFLFLTVLSAMVLVGCKKDTVDGSSTQAFQESINDMTSSLPTIQQIKFNEALYILKTFGVDAEGDIAELKALAQLLEGKQVPEIFAMADKVAQKNGVAWTSTGPPSLGEMNIFQNITPSETDPNDITASSLQLTTTETSADSLMGPQALMVVPRLVDDEGNSIAFENAALETVMEVFSQGEKLLTSRNLMQNNNYKGFYLKFSDLPQAKVLDGRIDLKVTVKTSKRLFQITRMGVSVNPNALKTAEDPEAVENTPEENSEGTDSPKVIGDPKNTVVNFLSQLNSQNLRGAYSQGDNANWGSYESFSNPTSGFGAVKSVSVKAINTKANASNTATVNASYTVTDKSGNTAELEATYGLKATETGWKITSYKINSSQKK